MTAPCVLRLSKDERRVFPQAFRLPGACRRKRDRQNNHEVWYPVPTFAIAGCAGVLLSGLRSHATLIRATGGYRHGIINCCDQKRYLEASSHEGARRRDIRERGSAGIIWLIMTFPHLLHHGSRSALLSWLGPVVMIVNELHGVRCPMALCVRSSLYSLRQASITTCASCTVRNQCSFKHLSRNFPLKLSIKAF